MYCTACGATVSDEAKFCPHCGEDLKEVREILKEPSSTSDISTIEGELELSLGGDASAVYMSANSSNEFEVIIHNTSQNSIPSVEVRLSGLHPDELISGYYYYGTILSGQKVSGSFIVRPIYVGSITLTATLKSGAGHSLQFPIQIRPRTEQGPTLSRPYSTTTRPSVSDNQVLAVLIVLALVGLLLMIGGISTMFSGGFSFNTGITLIVVGFILLTIGTKGQCCIFPLACACDDCDCDC
jgi:hypothetical protein